MSGSDLRPKSAELGDVLVVIDQIGPLSASRRMIFTEETYRTLCSRIDRAARSGALHKNTAARKKSRAMRLRARL